MGLYYNKRVLCAFALALSALIWLGILSHNNNYRFIESNKYTVSSNEILYHVQQTLNAVKDMETAQHEYVIVADSLFLQSYAKSQLDLNDHVEKLAHLTELNPGSQRRIVQLKAWIERRDLYSKSVIKAENTNFGLARVFVKSHEEKKFMDEIRQIILDLQNDELHFQGLEREQRIADMRKLNGSFIALTSFAGVLFCGVFIAVNNVLRQRIKAEQSLQKASLQVKDLYDNAPCGYLSVNASFHVASINQTLLNWLGYTREETILKMKYQDLLSDQSRSDFLSFHRVFSSFMSNGSVSNLKHEFKRKDGTTFPVIVNSRGVMDADGTFSSRTTVFDDAERQLADDKILQLNLELESFTYSVSHDLRAPLRIIFGYAQVLIEDHGNNIDAAGQQVIDVIIDNAKRMGKLIDDLLEFARMGRKEMSMTKVSFNKMVGEIIKELPVQRIEKQYEFQLRNLKSVIADPAMMHQVWTNLVSNAMKYSSKKDKPLIEIGSSNQEGEVCYYIKDNGAGFNMAYSDKLFGAFQRLHNAEEFEGTGVGLALVKRIVLRHGGRIWADAKVDEGAIFYFTLPNK